MSASGLSVTFFVVQHPWPFISCRFSSFCLRLHLVIYSQQVFACVGFAYPVWTKIRKKRVPGLNLRRKPVLRKRRRFSMKDGENSCRNRSDKGSWFNKSSLLEDDQLPLTSSALEGARRLKLEGLSMNRFPKTKRLQMFQYGLLIDKI